MRTPRLLAAVLTALLVVAVPVPASAHSLDSSSPSVHLGEDTADITVTVAAEALDAAGAVDVVAHLDEHLTVTGVLAAGTRGTPPCAPPARSRR